MRKRLHLHSEKSSQAWKMNRIEEKVRESYKYVEQVQKEREFKLD